jgi:hypothetical protein
MIYAARALTLTRTLEKKITVKMYSDLYCSLLWYDIV